MNLKLKQRTLRGLTQGSTVEPPRSHDATRLTALPNAASRHHPSAGQPASGAANHARHHVSRRTQSS